MSATVADYTSRNTVQEVESTVGRNSTVGYNKQEAVVCKVAEAVEHTRQTLLY